jgi:phage FluMu gp28-like protein
VVERKEDRLNLIHVNRFPLETNFASVIGYIKALCDRWRNVVAVYPDLTGIGEYVVEDMIRSGIPNVKGVKFTVESKENMASVLKDRMMRGDLRIPYDRELINELNVERYELTKTGHILFSHPEGTHDDRFWAVCLAGLGGRSPTSKPQISFGEVREK